jgi:surface protein
MKTFKEHILEKLKINKKDFVEHTLFPETKNELKQMIKDEIKKNRNGCSLNHIDVSNIEDMSELFLSYPNFNGDISGWDVSNVTNMSFMFGKSKFNGDISSWDVSNVTDMHGMFYNSKFNGDISSWDVSNVEYMHAMFYNSKFNGDISSWDVSNVEYMNGMFTYSTFNGDISGWDVSNVRDMGDMFEKCPLKNNPPIWYKK